MTRNSHYQLLQELDPNDVTNISEAHKKMLLAQGLKPFRTSHNQIKWANTATQIYKLSQQKRKFHFSLKKRTTNRPNRIKRHRRSHLLLAIKDNWILVLLLMMIAVSLLYVTTFHFNI